MPPEWAECSWHLPCMVQADRPRPESARGLNCRPRRGQQSHPGALGDRRAEEKTQALCEGVTRRLRDDRPGLPAATRRSSHARRRRRRVGITVTLVQLGATGQVRHPYRENRSDVPEDPRGNTAFIVDLLSRLNRCGESRTMHARRAQRDRDRGLRVHDRPIARARQWPPPVPVPAGAGAARPLLRGSPRPDRLADGRPLV